MAAPFAGMAFVYIHHVVVVFSWKHRGLSRLFGSVRNPRIRPGSPPDSLDEATIDRLAQAEPETSHTYEDHGH